MLGRSIGALVNQINKVKKYRVLRKVISTINSDS